LSYRLRLQTYQGICGDNEDYPAKNEILRSSSMPG
jgi:hypothetical protein